jgi:DmsE family decaheme c-type cytochrome
MRFCRIPVQATVGQPEVCFTCHRECAPMPISIHHPIVEARSNAAVPAPTAHHHAVKAENQWLCYQCHADKRGPFIWEHPPVAENCGICHLPHGSRHESLMVEKTNNLCNDCHDDGGHRATAIDATVFFGGANEDRHFLARGCVECHHSIHGSANFRNREFRN